MLGTYSAKPREVFSRWHVLDATNRPLGRLATEVARLLMGKHKPTYTPHILTGDFVIVVNASQIHVSGNKRTQKIYYRHSGYPGALRETPLEVLIQKHPTRVIEHAVRGMLPKNKLARHMLRRLKVYAGGDHPHEAQVRGSTRALELPQPQPRRRKARGRPAPQLEAAAEPEYVATQEAPPQGAVLGEATPPEAPPEVITPETPEQEAEPEAERPQPRRRTTRSRRQRATEQQEAPSEAAAPQTPEQKAEPEADLPQPPPRTTRSRRQRTKEQQEAPSEAVAPQTPEQEGTT